jgi:transcriptional regulator with XRE-family HTH domain
MPSTANASNRFANALRETRSSLGITQEDFGVVSSRTYVSSLERGIKVPTLSKIDELASVMGIHPLTLLTLAYAKSSDPKAVAHVLEIVRNELDAKFDLPTAL